MVHGRLTPGGPRSWPSLDGHVAVIPPSAVFGSERHTIPSAARLEKIRAELRDGIDVVVRGEVARAGLYAVSITARDGVLDL